MTLIENMTLADIEKELFTESLRLRFPHASEYVVQAAIAGAMRLNARPRLRLIRGGLDGK